MRMFEVRPKRPIPNILPNHKRIEETMTLPLSRNEFLRCMQFGDVYAVVGDQKILITTTDYNKAMELFGAENPNKVMKFSDRISPVDVILSEVKSDPQPVKEEEEETPTEPLPVKVVSTNHRSTVVEDTKPEEEKEEKEEPVKEEKNKQNVYSSKNYSKRNKK